MSSSDSKFEFNDADSFSRFRKRIAELEDRARGLSRAARHDMTNVLGAARNAMLLIEEGATGRDRQRFLEIAERNITRAERVMSGKLADVDPPRDVSDAPSGGNQRNDLRRTGERDDGDALGF